MLRLMVVESLTKANSYFNFGKIFGNKNGLDLYEKLNDNIFFEILYSSDERLKESRELLERIVKRKLYKFVTSVVLKSTADLEEKDFEDVSDRINCYLYIFYSLKFLLLLKGL